jgi:prepilin-type processing-associated H-X9-DG protein
MKRRTAAMKRIKRTAGFTLVELLAVTATLAILIALVMASLPRVMEAARRAKCTSNLRHIASGFASYIADNDNFMPQRFYHGMPGWIGYDELILPYLDSDQKLFLCPSHKNLYFPLEPSYGFNWFYDNVNISTVDGLTTTILLAEAYQGTNRETGSHRADRNNSAEGRIDSERHRGKANYLFFDGHVELLTWEQTLSPKDLWGFDYGLHDSTQTRNP